MTNENGRVSNGHGGPDVVTISSPYVTRRRRQEEIGPDDEAVQRTAEENAADEESVLTEDAPKSNRRRLGFVAFLLVALVGIAAVLYIKFGQTTKIDYLAKAKPKTGTILQPPGQGQQGQGQTGQQLTGENAQIEAAIAQMKEARRTADDANGAVGSSAPAISTAATSIPGLSLPSDYGASRPARSEGAGGAGYTGGGQGNPQRAQGRTMGQPKHGMMSLYADDAAERASPIPIPARTAAKRTALPALDSKPVALPAFGTMLPMRTLGGILTLRNSISRLELTQDVSGAGWRLKKGTVFVAQMAGGAYDRAYLNVTGFIDPSTNRMLKLAGEVLGEDAAQGLKGKRRQMTSRWSRAINYSLQVAPGIVQAALSRNGGTTVIVPVSGSASELIPSGNTDRREFVEVQAGATGYVLVTDLPDQIKGVDADPTEHLAEAAGVTKVAQKELSDSELAELLANGTPAEIREAMPRMNPAMRGIAALALGEK
jgi:hypothetical protein